MILGVGGFETDSWACVTTMYEHILFMKVMVHKCGHQKYGDFLKLAYLNNWSMGKRLDLEAEDDSPFNLCIT